MLGPEKRPNEDRATKPRIGQERSTETPRPALRAGLCIPRRCVRCRFRGNVERVGTRRVAIWGKGQ